MIPEAVALIEPLRKDSVDFVRQGAMIASGLLFMQTSDEQTDGKVGKLREELMRVLGDKHEDVLCRFGAILAFGLLEAGGRNSVASMYAKGNLRLGGAIGMAMFTQMWYWFPLIQFISLPLMPTALVGLTEKLKMPKNFVVRSEARPAFFAYPEAIKPPQKEEKKTGAKVKLSTTMKRETNKTKKQDSKESKAVPKAAPAAPKPSAASDVASNAASTNMSQAAATIGSSLGDDKLSIQGFDIEDHPSAADRGSQVDDLMPEAEDKDHDMEGEEKPGDKKDVKAATFEVLSNPCRVVPAQEGCIRYYARGRTVSMSQPEEKAEPTTVVVRYEPVNPDRKSGFLLLRDLDPESPEDILEFADVPKEEEEPGPPEPFEWTG
jgi:26S proteasome regulatory subunit N2